MKVRLFMLTFALTVTSSAAMASNDTVYSTNIKAMAYANAGDHIDRRNCQLAKRRGQELPRYCSTY